MLRVFISVSANIRSFNQVELAYLEQIVEGQHTILIGDNYGGNRVVQKMLAQQKYSNVIVYFSGGKARNNLGNWYTKQIPNPKDLTEKNSCQLKDEVMADDCDSGMLFWDGRCEDIQRNIDYLEKLGKYYLYLVKNSKASGIGNFDKINNMVWL